MYRPILRQPKSDHPVNTRTLHSSVRTRLTQHVLIHLRAYHGPHVRLIWDARLHSLARYYARESHTARFREQDLQFHTRIVRLSGLNLERSCPKRPAFDRKVSAAAKEAAGMIVAKFGGRKIRRTCAVGVGVWGIGDVLYVGVIFEKRILYEGY